MLNNTDVNEEFADKMIDTREMRSDLLKMALAAKSQGAHLGGSLSLVEIMAALYGGVTKFDSKNPEAENRDRVILSKGHGVMAQYVALKQIGLLSAEDLLTYKSDETKAPAHPSMNLCMGIEFSSGSLGQGLSLGVGTALALQRKNNLSARIYVILGDGEWDEGSVWEAAMTAAHYRLDNLVAVIDRNRLQYDGDTETVLPLENFADKWRAFGWNVTECDGHSVKDIVAALSEKQEKPFALIADTVKGKGVSFMENMPQWHNGVLTQKLFEQAMSEVMQ